MKSAVGNVVDTVAANVAPATLSAVTGIRLDLFRQLQEGITQITSDSLKVSIFFNLMYEHYQYIQLNLHQEVSFIAAPTEPENSAQYFLELVFAYMSIIDKTLNDVTQKLIIYHLVRIHMQ